MNRDRYITVTGFALLIPTSSSESEGEATFASEAYGTSHVRAITLDDIRAASRKLRHADAAHFRALLSLRGAFESNDQLAMGRAKEQMETVYRHRQAETPITDVDRDLGELFAPWINLPPEEAMKYVSGMRPGPKAASDLRRLFSYEVSEATGSLFQTRIVLWWFRGAFRPAVYCPDAKTALYVHTFFLAPAGGVGFRICPYDGEQFFQERPNQEYCCVAHREAHRVARFRDKQKRTVAPRREGGKNYGAQKTR